MTEQEMDMDLQTAVTIDASLKWFLVSALILALVTCIPIILGEVLLERQRRKDEDP